MKKKKNIFAPVSGIIQNISQFQENGYFKKKIIICSKNNIIVAPYHGVIKNYYPQKQEFVIQSFPKINIFIKSKFFTQKNQIIHIKSIKPNIKKIFTGNIVFFVNNLNKTSCTISSQIKCIIFSKKKIKTKKKKLDHVKAGITILAYIKK